ncbi:MAG: FkbM family methyltransferase [Gammaproteobacteria bacterium]
MANVSDQSALAVMSLPLDALNLGASVKLVKIDAEGHEISVLRGMWELLLRCRPSLSSRVIRWKWNHSLGDWAMVSENWRDRQTGSTEHHNGIRDSQMCKF